MKSKELIVGIFVASGLVILYFGFNFLKGIDFFSSSSKYYAVYDNVDALTVSNPVLVSGFAVGRVSHIKILQEQDNKVLVEIDINAEIVLNDSTKAILNSDFLGGKSIFLDIGHGRNIVEPGDTILAEAAKGIFDVFTESAEPVADNMQSTLRRLNTILDNLAKNSQHLDTLFLRLGNTPAYLNRTILNANSKIDELSVDLKSVTGSINGTLRDLKPTLANFKTLSDSLKQIEMNKTLLKTQETLASLDETLKKLKSGDNTVSRLMTEDSLYVNLNTLLIDLDSLVNHFDNNPKHFMAPLGKSQKKLRKTEDAKRSPEIKKKTSPAHGFGV
ncbi:MAG: MCE family protein [Flammeovirgaceae bacterium]|nr:MCE family protein [Flammeovirgaceae bacterium]